MIANPKWFSPRKYGGWGLTPNCWQGWAYIGLIAIPLFIINQLNLPGFWGVGVMLGWSLIFTVDLISVMSRLKKDEREVLHEALAERNAMWFMVSALGIGIAFQVASGIIKNTNEIDPVILVALFGALAVKGLTHWYLRDK